MDEIQWLGTVADGVAAEYIEGVPARNLSRAEWNALRSDQQAAALATGLYYDPLVVLDARSNEFPAGGREDMIVSGTELEEKED